MNTERANRGKALALTGAFLQLGPVVGFAGTIIGMTRAFNLLGSRASGIGDPAVLSAAIGDALISIMVGFALGCVGFVLLLIALLGCRYRAKWFLRFLVIYGGLLLLLLPLVTALCIYASSYP